MNKIAGLLVATIILLLTVSVASSANEAMRYREQYQHYRHEYLILLGNYTSLQDDYIQTLLEYGNLQDKYILLGQNHLEFIDNLTAVFYAESDP